MALSPGATGTTSTSPIQISDKHVEDFLLATQPCLANFPSEMRDKVREALQERVNRGEVSEKEFDDFARQASLERTLRLGSGF